MFPTSGPAWANQVQCGTCEATYLFVVLQISNETSRLFTLRKVEKLALLEGTRALTHSDLHNGG